MVIVFQKEIDEDVSPQLVTNISLDFKHKIDQTQSFSFIVNNSWNVLISSHILTVWSLEQEAN